MKRGLLVTVSGAAILIAGLSGCSSAEEPAAESSSSSESSAASETAEATSESTLTIDGADKPITGSPVCSTVAGVVNLAIGQGTTGIVALLSDGDAPTVTSVALGNVDGVSLAVGAGLGDATAEKDGSTYTIKGNATGADMANPMAGMVTKPFELVVACP